MASNGTEGPSPWVLKVLMRASARYFSRPFIYALMVSATIILISLIYGASQGNAVEFEVANQTLREVETIASEVAWYGIFINNAGLAFLTFVPLIGAVWMTYLQFNTGWYLGAIAKAYNFSYIVATSIVLTNVVGLIEYSAYIIALGESLFMVLLRNSGKIQDNANSTFMGEYGYCCFIVVCRRGCRSVSARKTMKTFAQ